MLKNVICFDDKSASKDDKDRIGNKCFVKRKDVQRVRALNAMSGSRASILRQIKNDVNFGEMKNSGTFAAVIGFTTRFIVCE